MTKILLIQPKSPETFWKLTGWLRVTKEKALVPPLALATVAALTPSEFEVEIVDEEVEDIDFDTPCDLVGITGYTHHALRMFEIAAEFRKRGVLTVGGGSACTIHEKDFRPHFDVLIVGEAEEVWPRFLAEWYRGGHHDLYRGARDLDLSLSPPPRWNLLDLSPYNMATVQTSRGCPYDCEFCDVVALFGHRMRTKPIEHILLEIRNLEQADRKRIFLADDNLIGNKGFVKELLKALIEFNGTLKEPISYYTQLTLNVAKDEELLDLFKEANFPMVFIGIETPKEESLVETNKKHNLLMDIKEAVRRIQSRGIVIISGLIVGFDSDDLDIFPMQSRFLVEAGLIVPMLATLKAPRGTKLWDRLNREGRLIQGDKCDTFGEFSCNFIPKNMTKTQLEENCLALFREVYSFPHFLKRFNNLIDQVDLNKVKTDSPLAWNIQSRKKRECFLATAYMIKHFVLDGDREKRRFFFSLVRTALRKGIVCFPLVYETLIFFISQSQFVRYLEHRATQPMPLPSPLGLVKKGFPGGNRSQKRVQSGPSFLDNAPLRSYSISEKSKDF